jgi:hypothetical protein
MVKYQNAMAEVKPAAARIQGVGLNRRKIESKIGYPP